MVELEPVQTGSSSLKGVNVCVIVYKPAKEAIDFDFLKYCFDNHPDGAGFMYFDNHKVVVKKSLDYFEFERSLRNVISYKSDFVIHFRSATVGKVGLKNTQPFLANNLGFVHQGTLALGSKDKSDSLIFCQKYLMLPEFQLNAATISAIEKNVGNSKMAFMDGRGKVEIINEHLGEWKFGLWTSRLRNQIGKTCLILE